MDAAQGGLPPVALKQQGVMPSLIRLSSSELPASAQQRRVVFPLTHWRAQPSSKFRVVPLLIRLSSTELAQFQLSSAGWSFPLMRSNSKVLPPIDQAKL
jgi:hypothetical protein